MANQRQLERLMQHVQRLPQYDEYWAATSRLARMWITPKRASPYPLHKLRPSRICQRLISGLMFTPLMARAARRPHAKRATLRSMWPFGRATTPRTEN